MGKCKNCKNYRKPTDKSSIKKDKGCCDSKKFVYNYPGNKGDKSYPLNDKLEYWDYEGYNAGFAVGKNFGCIHFKEK